MNRLSMLLAINPGSGEMFQEILDAALAATGSELGYFGYIDEKMNLVVPTLTEKVWDICNIKDKSIVFTQDQWVGLTQIRTLRYWKGLPISLHRHYATGIRQ